MDFFINHSGFFFGILVIVLLAVIGYFADKKDNEKKETVKKSIESNKVDVKYDNTALASFNDLPNVDGSINNSEASSVGNSDKSVIDGVGDVSILNSSYDNLNNDVTVSLSNSDVPFEGDVNDINFSQTSGLNLSNDNSAQLKDINSNDASFSIQSNDISFNSSDFESLDLSLEDLEKKNFDTIVQSKDDSDDENFYYSNMEEGNLPVGVSESGDVIKDNNSNLQDVFSSQLDSISNDGDFSREQNDVIDNAKSSIESSDVSLEGNIDSNNISDFNNDVASEENNASIDNNSISSSVESELSDNDVSSFDVDSEHLFDNETQSDSNMDDVFNFSNTIGDQQVIPELFDSNRLSDESSNNSSDNSLNLEEDTNSDDIWKF